MSTKDLQIAAHYDDIARMKQLLAEGADINEVGMDGWGVVLHAIMGEQVAALSWLLTEGEASIDDVGEYLWTSLPSENADAAELSSLLKVLVMLEDAPVHFISRCSPQHAELCERGRQFRAQLPSYRVQQQESVMTICPLPTVLQSIVAGYAATTPRRHVDGWAAFASSLNKTSPGRTRAYMGIG
jgi:hypothetical protein